MTAPGLPTMEQVREHAERGGLWRYRDGTRLQFVCLHWRYGDIRWSNGIGELTVAPLVEVLWMACTDWTPCDRDGNPLELVEAAKARQHEPPEAIARPASEWHEDHGTVLWWHEGYGEPPYVGSPLNDDWEDGLFTHWTPIPNPVFPETELAGE